MQYSQAVQNKNHLKSGIKLFRVCNFLEYIVDYLVQNNYSYSAAMISWIESFRYTLDRIYINNINKYQCKIQRNHFIPFLCLFSLHKNKSFLEKNQNIALIINALILHKLSIQLRIFCTHYKNNKVYVNP